MVRKIIFTGILLVSFGSYAQPKDPFAGKSLLKVNIELNQGIMLQHKCSNIYISGNAEYFTSKWLSIRGDCYWYLDSRKNPVLNHNGIILFGAFLHKQIGRNDFHIGMQPGVAIAQPGTKEDHYAYHVLPAFSLSAGYTFYISKLCNFFLGATWLSNSYRGSPIGTIHLDEIQFSGGLGFQIRTKK
jgi:hypothetical protein